MTYYRIAPGYVCLSAPGARRGVLVSPVNSRRVLLNADALRVVTHLEQGHSLEHLIHTDARTAEAAQQARSFVTQAEARGYLVGTAKPGMSAGSRLRRLRGGPTALFVELTRRCNLQCAHCYNAGREPARRQLTLGELYRLVDEASSLGAWQAHLTGGEPLLRADIWRLLTHLQEKAYHVTLFTNGVLIDASVADRLAEHGNLCVATSLEGFLDETHDEFRGSAGARRRTVAAIRRLRQRGVAVRVNITVTRRNVHEIARLLRFVTDDLGATYRLDSIVPVGRGEATARDNLPDTEFAKLVAQFVGSSYIASEQVTSDKRMRNGNHCGVGSDMMFVECDGTVSLCPTLNSSISPSFTLGRFPNSSVKGIWSGQARQRFASIRCRSIRACHVATLCRGGCRSRAYFSSHDLTAPDGLSCKVYRALTARNQHSSKR
jgi:radical SAM protein with 4Fe4S-binding SPASM domain